MLCPLVRRSFQIRILFRPSLLFRPVRRSVLQRSGGYFTANSAMILTQFVAGRTLRMSLPPYAARAPDKSDGFGDGGVRDTSGPR